MWYPGAKDGSFIDRSRLDVRQLALDPFRPVKLGILDADRADPAFGDLQQDRAASDFLRRYIDGCQRVTATCVVVRDQVGCGVDVKQRDGLAAVGLHQQLQFFGARDRIAFEDKMIDDDLPRVARSGGARRLRSEEHTSELQS